MKNNDARKNMVSYEHKSIVNHLLNTVFILTSVSLADFSKGALFKIKNYNKRISVCQDCAKFA